MSADQIQYSEKYYDAIYEYRHVILPPDLTKHVPKSHLMTETEWRNLGVQQSPGWVHYMMHAPEPHVILFRRPRQPSTTVTVAAATSTSTNSRANTEQAPQASQPQQSAANNDVSVHG